MEKIELIRKYKKQIEELEKQREDSLQQNLKNPIDRFSLANYHSRNELIFAYSMMIDDLQKLDSPTFCNYSMCHFRCPYYEGKGRDDCIFLKNNGECPLDTDAEINFVPLRDCEYCQDIGAPACLFLDRRDTFCSIQCEMENKCPMGHYKGEKIDKTTLY